VSAVALAGWAAALCACGGASWLWTQLSRRVELVADAGHELRGPLCAARLGLHGLGDEERASAVDLELRRAALALDELVAAGRGRRLGPRVGLVDVGALLDDGAEAWQPLAAAFGGVVIVEPMRGRALVRADPGRLAQACGNLVANAVEHGGSPVRVRGRVVAGRVRIEVSDTGPGLPAPVAELVARRRGRGAPRGRGLGIAARTAESSGGRLSSAPSAAGARLVLEFPSADAAPAVERPASDPRPEVEPPGVGWPRAGLEPPRTPAPRVDLELPRAGAPLWPEPWQIWPPDPPPPPSPPRGR